MRPANSPGVGPKRERGFYYGYIIVLITFLMMVLGWGIFYIYGVFFTPLSREFEWSRAVTSGAFSASVMISGIVGLFAGRICDRLGPRIVIIFCSISLSLGYALMSLVQNVWEFYLIYAVLIAAGIGGFWSPLVATVGRWFSGRRGLMTGIVSGGISFGTLVLPPIATQLISAYSWRTTYVIISVVILVLVMLTVRFLKNNPAPYFQPADKAASSVSVPVSRSPVFTLKEALATRQLWMVSIIYVCFGLVQLVIMVHIVPYASGSGISDISASLILSLVGGASLAGRIIMGFVADRIRVKSASILCLALLVAATAWLQFSHGLWQLYLFALVFGFGYGGLSCLQSLIAAELYGLVSLGVITAIFSLSFDIGGAIGPVLAGYIFDLSRSYFWAFLLCLIVVAVALVISLVLKPPVKK